MDSERETSVLDLPHEGRLGKHSFRGRQKREPPQRGVLQQCPSIPSTSDLSRCVSNEVLERSGHMRLIGIASLIRCLKQRNAPIQESLSLLRAFDLRDHFVREPGCE